jgi:asparagine synthase (glutamine-hydrolysing)
LVAVAAAQKLGKGIPTFAIGFSDPDFDESRFAKAVADQIHSEHHVRIIGESDLLERWKEIVDKMDEPLADPSILPTRLLCELAKDKVKVVLGGDAGDELFGGYPTYRAHQMKWALDILPAPLLSTLQTIIHHIPTGSGYQPLGWKLKRLINRYERDSSNCHFRWMSGTDQKDIYALTSRRSPLLPPHYLLDDEDLVSMMWLDLIHYLPYSVLTKVDRASMAVGLEARPPFLTNAFVEFAMSVPLEQKVNRHETKIMLRETARAYLPDEIVNRPKRGFAIPLASWLKGPLRNEVEKMLKESPIWEELKYDPKQFQKCWYGLLSGKDDSSKTIWSFLVLDRWLKTRTIDNS